MTLWLEWIGAAAMLVATPQAEPVEVKVEVEQPTRSGPWNDMYREPQHPGATYRVRLFVHAAQACLHFAGEEPYDAERAEFLNAMMDESCAGLKERYAAILADPTTDAPSRALVETAWEPFRE
ncbi:hypothetical protein [Blastomonas sp. SL216]|uniref:hypothetical protein n=1 Tax=Blastomonas sp. SL216 TaxID=2995169 RepID=UPI002377CBBE|nr:hypothetical protein OU999_14815 [Blastomonas sp. SL216]